MTKHLYCDTWTEWRKLGKGQLEVLFGPVLSLGQNNYIPKDLLPVDGGLDCIEL